MAFTFTTQEQQVEALFIGYFGRAGAPFGVNYWIDRLNGFDPTTNTAVPALSLAQEAASFSVQAEATTMYPFLANPNVGGIAAVQNFVNSVFLDLFNRLPTYDGTGHNFWVDQLNANRGNPQAVGDAIINIISGAQGGDATTLSDKITVAQYFTDHMATLGVSSFNTEQLVEAHTVVAATTSDPASVTAQEAAIDAFIATQTIPGTEFDLKVGVDHIQIPTLNTVDHVVGTIDKTSFGPFALTDNSTFSSGDVITGNGHTVVDVTVNHLASATSGQTADLVHMSGVSTVNITQAQHFSELDANAVFWGSVNNVNVNGLAQTVELTNLNITNGGGLKLAIATTGTANLSATGKVSGLNYSASLQNGTGVGSVAKFGLAGIDVNLGNGGGLNLTLSHAKVNTNAASGAASVGDISIGHVNVTAAPSADSTIELANYAKAYSNNATVGNVTVGDVNYALGHNGGTSYFSIFNSAMVAAGTGNAKAGNIAVGNVTANTTGTLSNTAGFSGNIYNYAWAETGNATVGSVTVGNVSVSAHGSASFSVRADASADKGNVTVGDIKVGNVTLAGSGSHTFNAAQYAEVNTAGNAQVGNLTVGNLSMVGGESQTGFIYQSAEVDKTGNATVGNITVGNVNLVSTKDGSGDLSVSQYAVVGESGGKGGAATVGNVTIGNVTMMVGSSSNTMDVYQEARNLGTKAHDATVGNLTIGNIAMNNAPGVNGGSNSMYIYRSASAAHGNAIVGNVTIGNVSINAANVSLASNASNSLSIYNEAFPGAGGVATVGTITVGNIVANTGVSGKLHVEITNSADGDNGGIGSSSGLVTVGNVAMQGGSSASMLMTVDNYAASGAAGGITIGNVSMKSTKPLASGELFVQDSGATAGKVTIGNVAITAAKVDLQISNYASSILAGGVSVGNVTLNGNNEGTANFIEQSAPHGAAGTLSVGNVSLNNLVGGNLTLDVTNQAHDKVGAVTLGNITAGVHNVNGAAADNVTLAVHVSSTSNFAGGNITAGNITVGSSGDTTVQTAANMAVHVTLSSEQGSVTVGNITVTGGLVGSGPAHVLDNLGHLGATSAWLILDAGAVGAKPTIGNVDYHGYVGGGAGTGADNTLIDVSGYKGAASILGSTGGSEIIDNSGTNAIDISNSTSKVDLIVLQDSQTGVHDSGTVLTATQSAVDSITGIGTGDKIYLGPSVGGTVLTGTTITQAGAMSFAQFLTNAETDLHSGTDAAYSAVVGGNTLVALHDNTNHVTEIVQVTGVHTFTVDANSDLLFAA